MAQKAVVGITDQTYSCAMARWLLMASPQPSPWSERLEPRRRARTSSWTVPPFAMHWGPARGGARPLTRQPRRNPSMGNRRSSTTVRSCTIVARLPATRRPWAASSSVTMRRKTSRQPSAPSTVTSSMDRTQRHGRHHHDAATHTHGATHQARHHPCHKSSQHSLPTVQL